MSSDSSAIVSKVWNYAHVLKNAGVGYGDYVEQITYLLFGSGLRPPGCHPTLRVAYVRCAPVLKLADEMTDLGFDNPIPAEFQWSERSSKVAAASRRRLFGLTQRRDASAALFPSWPTN